LSMAGVRGHAKHDDQQYGEQTDVPHGPRWALGGISKSAVIRCFFV
jgi:hypothetical protein